ncbi:MobF family relaxase [Candidatus Rhodobacter oscarellae]|uniref:MobF family relaxase n=1 Tax=Candidatus Rhodobacter oscarellae TaxID=1675527 RepID=UPI000671314A|nr:MobF family relaxase [Candidatus Rhodobacter lobularis]
MSAEQTFGYFLHEYLARNDSSHRSANRWHGAGAESLGLGQRVGKRKFISILSGHVPGTDITLGRVIDGTRQHRPGWDMTFSAPKSVSLEALFRGRRAVMHAHDEAVRATLDWIEQEYLQTRGYDPATGQRPREAADGMIAATFRHMASRNNDPQLHTHAVVANMTRNKDGAWRSVEPTLLKRNRRVFGAWYRNDLARRLRSLGYELTSTTVGGLPSFEISGWSREWLDAFSTRRQDILQHMADEGREYTTANAQAAALVTRGKKAEPVKGALVKLWHRRAERLGLVEEPRSRTADSTQMNAVLSPLEAVWHAMEHLEERQCVFRRTDLLAAALGREPGRHSHEELEAAIDRLRRDRHLVDTTSGDMTTRQTLRAERTVIATMREGRSAPLANALEVTAQLDATSLTDGQRNAVRTILLSEDRIVGVQGFAGTGKTRMLKEVVRLAGDRSVIGLAPSSAAARVLALEAGIGTTTLQWMLARYGHLGDGPDLQEARERFRGAVIVVDEASMIGTVQMRDLQRVAERIGAARLALVGDRLQLWSVEAGQPFRLLQEAGMATARMDDVLRQRSTDLKAAVTHMIAGDADLAVQSLGRDVRELPPDRLAETAAQLWLALPPDARRRTMLLAPTHGRREEINAVLRKGLAEEGLLAGRKLEIEHLVDRRLTRVLAADPMSYRAGDIVAPNRDVYGCKEGEAWRVTGSDKDRIALERRGVSGGFRPSGNAAHNVSVFETRPIELRAGDEIVFTRNLRNLGVVNGERGRIEEIGRKRLRIRLADGRRLEPLLEDDRLRHIDHAWTSTVHRAQGMTTDNVIAVLDADSMMTDRALLYVEMSRARDGFVLLTDDTEQLVHRLEQETGVSHSALEATGQALHVPHLCGVSRKEPLRPALREWQALEAEAAQMGIEPFLMPGAEALMARLRRRVAIEDAPKEIVQILTDHDAHVRGQDFDAIGEAWQSLRARAAEAGRSVAVQPGADALLKRTGGLHNPGPLLEALAGGVQECSALLCDLGERLERCGTGISREARERDDALAGLERDWKAQRIKAKMQSHDIAFLPGTEALTARTHAIAEQYPGALPKATVEHAKDCERVQQRWARLVTVADVLANGAKTAQPPEESTCRAMAEAEELIADDRLTHRAQVEGVLGSVLSALFTLNERHAVEDRAQDLRKNWKTLEAEAERQGCYPFQVAGYGRFVERLTDFGYDLPPDLAALPELEARDRRLRRAVNEVVAFDARRWKIIKRAARWRPDTPLDRSRLTSYGRWARSAPKMIEKGKRLAAEALLCPDDRQTLERALERIIASLDGCGLEARRLGILEEINDRADAQGCHRFFVEGYDTFFEGLGERMVVGPGKNTLAVRERAVRDDMRYAQAFVKGVDSDLTKALRQWEDGGERFVAEMHPYHRWERETKSSLENVRRVLSNKERYGPHLARVPGLEERLRETAASVSEKIKHDAPVRKEVEAAHAVRVEREIATRARERALTRSRGPSRSMGLEM